MIGILAATQPARTIIVQRGGAIVNESGGTPWWVPVVTTLAVALTAAAVSYAVSWRFKRADVDRENALRAVDRVDEAEQIASLDYRWRDEGHGGLATHLLLQEARVRADPLDDDDLEDRFQAALTYNSELLGWSEKRSASAARHWLGEAIGSVREGLLPHLQAPRFIPRKRWSPRWFPTKEELRAMPSDPYGRDGKPRIDALVDWKAQQDWSDSQPGGRDSRGKG